MENQLKREAIRLPLTEEEKGYIIAEVDNTVKNWIARDKIGMLYLYDSKPYLPFDNSNYYTTNGHLYDLPNDWFPELTFENSPKMVGLKLI
jgi:hypothetical protein